MRVCVNGRFLGAPPTGVQRFASEVTRRLADRTEVVLLTPSDAVFAADEVPSARRIQGRLPGVAWEQLELPLAARRAGADVVLHPANAAPWWGGPHVVVLHDLAPLTEPRDFRVAYRLWVRVGHLGPARRAAGVATVSRWSAATLARRIGRSQEEIVVVSQGAAPLEGPVQPEAVAAARREHGLAGPYFLALVRGDPRKGLDFLERLWEDWEDGDRPTLVVVGRSRGRALDRRRLGASTPGVRDLGAPSDDTLRALVGGAVALLHPSRSEGFGRPPLEALACGTPAVVAPYGPAREVLADAAEIVPLDPAAWRRTLWTLLTEDSSARARRVDAGRKQAANHRWDDSADALLDLCRRVAEGG